MEYLSIFLTDLTQVEIVKNNEGKIFFKSINNEYCFVKEKEEVKFIEIRKITTEEQKERKNYFIILENLYELMHESITIENIKNNLSIRSIIFKDFKYEFLYYKSINKIKIINTKYLNNIELLTYAEKYLKEDIKNKIQENHYFIIEKNECGILCQTKVQDKKIIFQYNIDNNDIRFIEVEYIFKVLGIDYKKIEEKIISMLGNNKFKIIEELSSDKELKSIIIQNKECKFVHFMIIKKILLLEIKELKEEDSGFLSTSIDDTQFTEIEIEKYNKLTSSLSKEEDCFLRRISSFEETIIKQINKRKTIHNVNYQGYNYEFLLKKTRKEGYLILVMKKEMIKPKS